MPLFAFCSNGFIWQSCELFKRSKGWLFKDIVDKVSLPKWPLAKSKLAPPFCNLSDEELMTHCLDVPLR